MEKKLENIFVPYEIAKLAYEKGFREWCCALVNVEGDFSPNVNVENDNIALDDFDFHWYTGMYPYNYISAPTHFQLMAWLQSNHNVQINVHKKGGFTVFDKDGFMKFDKGKPRFEINKALEIALNTLPDIS